MLHLLMIVLYDLLQLQKLQKFLIAQFQNRVSVCQC